MKNLIAVVPARAGSKGLPGKNTRKLGGKALWLHSVDQGLAAGADEVLVTTDIPEVLQNDGRDKLTIQQRPVDLSGDDVPMGPVLLHALADDRFQGSLVILLQPTSPLREVSDIRMALDIYLKGSVDLVMSVTETDRSILKYGTIEEGKFRSVREQADCFANRQSLPRVFRPNGAIYVFARDWFIANGGFVTDRIAPMEMDAVSSEDIDTQADWDRVAAKIAARPT